jgi:tetratricopeptide (TPR) repeat protein
MTNRRWALAVVALVTLGAGRGLAASPETEKQARRSFERAEAHFKAGLFAEALAEYRAGYDQLPLPGFLINIAQCQRRMGDLVQARTTYQKFIMVAPDSPYVDEVKSLVVELDRLIEASEADGATARPADDAAALSPPPVSNTTPVPTEKHEASLTAAPELPPAPARAGPRWWLWGGIAAAAVVGTVVTVYLVRSPGTTTLHEGSLGTLRR